IGERARLRRRRDDAAEFTRRLPKSAAQGLSPGALIDERSCSLIGTPNHELIGRALAEGKDFVIVGPRGSERRQLRTAVRNVIGITPLVAKVIVHRNQSVQRLGSRGESFLVIAESRALGQEQVEKKD